MNPIQIASYRTPHVLWGAVCFVAMIIVNETRFLTTYFNPGFWRSAFAMSIASIAFYGIYSAILHQAESREELVARLCAFAFCVIVIYTGKHYLL